MEELIRVELENEMDLIVAHKRSMRLAELAGLSLAAQTTFATAVSEVARYAMEQGAKPVSEVPAESSSAPAVGEPGVDPAVAAPAVNAKTEAEIRP